GRVATRVLETRRLSRRILAKLGRRFGEETREDGFRVGPREPELTRGLVGLADRLAALDVCLDGIAEQRRVLVHARGVADAAARALELTHGHAERVGADHANR